MSAADAGESERSLWDLGFFRLPRVQQAAVPLLRSALRNCANSLGHYLADVRAGSPAGIFGKADVAAVESHLIDSLGKQEAMLPLRILKTVISSLNSNFQKSIPDPTRLDRLIKDPNLLPENLSELRRRVAGWAQAENRWSDRHSGFAAHAFRGDSPNAEGVEWQMVIASAALHCGLLSVDRAVALARALAEPREHFGSSAIRGYADLALMTAHGRNEEVIRWYPDLRLLLLISRVSGSGVRKALSGCLHTGAESACKRKIAQTILDGICAEFERQGLDPGLMPRSLSNFLGTIAQSLQGKVPSILVDYASAAVSTSSLLPDSIGRINGDPTVYLPGRLSRADANPGDRVPDLREAYSSAKEEPDWMQRLRSAFRDTNPTRASRAIGEIAQACYTTPAGRQLCTLARKLLTGPAYSGNSWDPASIKCCILTVARRFAVERKDEDPATYSRTTLEELYRLALDEAAENSASPHRLQHAVAWALRAYHRHLVCVYGAATIREAVAFRLEAGPDPVDAHVLSVDEIFRAIEYIESSRDHRWKRLYRTVAQGQMVLAFAGLRRAEGLGLLPSDLLPGPLCEVTVQDNEIRTLKSENAFRRVPLGALLHPFSVLLRPVHGLFREARSLGCDLSCGVSDDVTVPIIHEAMRAVAGTEECHLHTLRHSAAHWMFMRLMVADLDGTPEIFPHLPKTTLWLRTAKEFRSILLHNGYATNDHAWAVAVMMGHSDPTTVTLRYYVHCLDLLLPRFLEARSRLGAPASRGELRRLSGLRRSTAYLRLPANTHEEADRVADETTSDKPSGFDPLQAFVLEIFRDRLGLKVESSPRATGTSSQAGYWLRDTYDVLWMSAELGLSCERLATIFGLDRRAVGAMISRANCLLSGRKAQRFPEDGGGGGEVPLEARIEDCRIPRLPRAGIESEVLQRWSAALEKLVGLEPNCMDAALPYMALKMLPAHGYIVFAGDPRPELMQSCVRVLGALGFRLDDLDAITCDGTDHATPSRKWMRSWGLSWRIAARNQSGRDRTLKIPPPWLLVVLRTLAGRSELTELRQMEALQFLLQMAAIRFSS